MKSNKQWGLSLTDKIQHAKLFEMLFSFTKPNMLLPFGLFLMFLNFSHNSFSQNIDSTKAISNFEGAVSVTNNGISLIPTFALGKPAATFDLAMGRRKLSFEPEFQFSLEGKPWSFFFWWRYKLINNSRFLVRVGAHPALSFSTLPVVINGITQETITTQRYLAGEFCPNYFLTANISVGAYYLYSYGLDNEYVRNTHFAMLNMNFARIRLTKQLSLGYMPQVYYLRINDNEGYNVTSSLTLTRKNFPVFISAFVNKTIQSTIPGQKDFVWNLSLIYSFHHDYVVK